jgi:hypothetical protein
MRNLMMVCCLVNLVCAAVSLELFHNVPLAVGQTLLAFYCFALSGDEQ